MTKLDDSRLHGDTETLRRYGRKGATATNARRRAIRVEMRDMARDRGDQYLPDDELPADLRALHLDHEVEE